MAKKQPSLSNDSNKNLKEQRHIKFLNTFPKSEQPENNTVYIEVLNHHNPNQQDKIIFTIILLCESKNFVEYPVFTF